MEVIGAASINSVEVMEEVNCTVGGAAASINSVQINTHTHLRGCSSHNLKLF